MARNWSGFLPQNEVVKAKWRLMEASEGEVKEMLDAVSRQGEQETISPDEEEREAGEGLKAKG